MLQFEFGLPSPPWVAYKWAQIFTIRSCHEAFRSCNRPSLLLI